MLDFLAGMLTRIVGAIAVIPDLVRGWLQRLRNKRQDKDAAK